MKLGIINTVVILFLGHLCFGQLKKAYLQNESYTYDEAISAFETMSKTFSCAKMVEWGKTDVGRPLHVCIFNDAEEFDSGAISASDKTVILINNAIHPGESCGVDASILLMEELTLRRKEFQNVIVIVIPVYNIGGMLNRSPYNRTGQPGPVECGFRGSYQNLDLNRDFIKCDSKNAFSFIEIFHAYDPDVFIDTHTTNGSDHQYTLTVITSQISKMNPVLKQYVLGALEPTIYTNMKARNKEVIPYVNTVKGTPDKGIADFMETPRFSSGYATLFDCMAFITEAHKYKSFEDRVLHTHAFLEEMVRFGNENAKDIKGVRAEARKASLMQSTFAGAWELDTTEAQKLFFKGYKTVTKTSEVTKCEFTTYDPSQKLDVEIPYYRNYKAKITVNAPEYYVIPQCYPDAIERLRANKVELKILDKDSLIYGTYYYVEDYKTVNTPYENHFLHSAVQVRQVKGMIQFYKGDYLVSTTQRSRRYIVEVLEPQFEDSYFNWNFFDNVLQQKEWFSPFAFESIANTWLEQDLEMKKEFEKKRAQDSIFAANHNAQLYWIYKQTPYYEKSHNRYPIVRID
ncbi:MAG: hypothetical protein KDC83_09210 [Flavobacteriales bacterium]|nr:hypothetical protein [Flavobacteriales bacterium]